MTQNIHDWVRGEIFIFFAFILPLLIAWLTIWIADPDNFIRRKKKNGWERIDRKLLN